MVSTKTDYSLTGPNADRAKAAGLVDAVWYSTPVPRPVMKQLMARRNGPAVRDTLIWILALATFGTLAYLSWGSWLAVPFFAIYGILTDPAAIPDGMNAVMEPPFERHG